MTRLIWESPASGEHVMIPTPDSDTFLVVVADDGGPVRTLWTELPDAAAACLSLWLESAADSETGDRVLAALPHDVLTRLGGRRWHGGGTASTSSTPMVRWPWHPAGRPATAFDLLLWQTLEEWAARWIRAHHQRVASDETP